MRSLTPVQKLLRHGSHSLSLCQAQLFLRIQSEMEDRDIVCKNSMVLGYGNSERVYAGQHIYHGRKRGT